MFTLFHSMAERRPWLGRSLFHTKHSCTKAIAALKQAKFGSGALFGGENTEIFTRLLEMQPSSNRALGKVERSETAVFPELPSGSETLPAGNSLNEMCISIGK